MKFPTPNNYSMHDGLPIVNLQDISVVGTRDHRDGIDALGNHVICLGCSFTYGSGVSVLDSYPAQLDRAMRNIQFYPIYKVYNMGRRNYGLRLCIDWYKQYASRLKPSTCVLQLPDMARQPYPFEQPDELIYYTANYGSRNAIFTCSLGECYKVALAMYDLMDADLDRLDSFRAFLLSNRTRLVVLLYQGAFGSLEPFGRMYFDRVEKYLKENNVSYVYEDWRNLYKAGLLGDGTHPNAGGNYTFAKKLAGVVWKAS